MASCAATFTVPELLENLLLYLPLRDLLLAQRVSRGWRAAIQSSSKAHKALFLVPLSQDVVLSGSNYEKEKPAHVRPTLGSFVWETEAGQQLLRRPLLNPFLNEFLSRSSIERDVPWVSIPHEFVSPLASSASEQDGRQPETITRKHRPTNRLYQILPMQPPARSYDTKCPETCHIYRCAEGTGKDAARLEHLKKGWACHWAFCPNCPVWNHENRWNFCGSEDVQICGDVDQISGWEMLKELKTRFETA